MEPIQGLIESKEDGNNTN